jgi:hypothetical protein
MQESLAGVAQLVERNLAKVEVASSSLVARSIYGAVAQLGERLNGIQEVVSSILIGSTNIYTPRCHAVSAAWHLYFTSCNHQDLPCFSSTIIRGSNHISAITAPNAAIAAPPRNISPI